MNQILHNVTLYDSLKLMLMLKTNKTSISVILKQIKRVLVLHYISYIVTVNILHY